ncbi:NADH-quinone oxidoreductase subunit L [bacterium]|nr:NADH-quinone oxidoreductase subunit L [bacterium]
MHALVAYAYLIPLLPLAAFVLIIFFGHRYFYRGSAWLAVLCTSASFVLSLAAFLHVLGGHGYVEPIRQDFTWIANFAPGAVDATGAALLHSSITLGVYIDRLAALMLMVVAGISTLTIFYSIGYMHEDPRYPRFFAYKSFFAFSMLGLVAAPNFFQMFVFWELVGLASYLLIGFWFEKTSASDAAKKAFITNRIGDVGFLIGLLLLFYYVGTVTFSDLTPDLLREKGFVGGMATFIGLALFCGAVGKSAQFPLHVWLPDAMEGPTSVSALIHSATMVAAGVYMIVRAYPVFAASETTLATIAAVGAITALGAAYIALTQTDIKRILAYSTLSQLGYMIFSCGCLGPVAAFFHLVTHACFKSLLFLGSGSVIHACHHEQDIRSMGSLRRYLPITHGTFLIACLALAGVFPLAGFFSKDEILLSAWHRYPAVFIIGEIVAALTAFYIFRLYFVAFGGERFRGTGVSPVQHGQDAHVTAGGQHGQDAHATPHESPWTMTLPLVILAILAVGVGWINWPWAERPWLAGFVHVEGGQHHHLSYLVMGVSTAAALLGLFFAWRKYSLGRALPPLEYSKVGFWYRLSLRKFWIDEFYKKYIVDGFTFGFCVVGMHDVFDRRIVDAFVNLCGRAYMLISAVHGLFDKYVVDGLVNFSAWFLALCSTVARRTQTGLAQSSLLILVLGLLVLIVWSAMMV